MGFFQDTILNVKSAFETIGEKTGKAIDVSKLKLSECELKNEISKEFENLGKIVYNSEKLKIDDERIKNKIDAISILYDQLNEVSGQIADIKQKRVCPNCSAVNSAEMLYCGKCGCKISTECDCECVETEKALNDEIEENNVEVD